MKWFVSLGVVILLFGLLGIRTVSALEQPAYRLQEKYGRLEIREYQPVMLATTTLSGRYDESIRNGFRSIAGYIFGQNQEQEKIAMTAPVLVENPNASSYQMAFVMPQQSVQSGLPSPSSTRVQLQEETWGTVAVWTFGGWATEKRIQKEWSKMKEALAEQNIQATELNMIAQYNPPSLPPPFRKNELWVYLSPQ